jgi:hypothetical protein
MAKTKKKVDSVETVDSVDSKHSIPMAGERPAKTSRVVDRFRKKAKPNTKEVKDNDRPIMQIDEETQHRFVSFAATKELFDIFEESKKEQTDELYSTLFRTWKSTLWKNKSQPITPKIIAKNELGKVDAEGQFIIQTGSKIKINMPSVGEDESPEEVLTMALVNAGLNQPSAERLVEQEVSFVPQWSLNFTDLLHGVMEKNKLQPASDLQIGSSEALFQVINGEDADGNPLASKDRLDMLKSITEDGWNALKFNVEKHTSYFPSLVDSASFLDRVCGYCNSPEELDAVLLVFKPVNFCSHVKFGVSDSSVDREQRMQDKAKAIVRDGCGGLDSSDEEIQNAYNKEKK